MQKKIHLLLKIIEDILSESVESRINRLNLNSFDEISIIKDSQNLISNEIEVENVQIVIYQKKKKKNLIQSQSLNFQDHINQLFI